MRLLIDINHPSQVHLFKHAIWKWQHHGHKVLVVARDKDITLQLLEDYGFDYVPGTVRKSGLANLLWELFRKTNLIFKVGRKFKPDLLLSLGSPAAAWASKLLGRDHIAFTDTEHSTEQLLLYKPFSTRIYTPENFLLNLGAKQRRYQGYHELAYLHPNYFQPNPKSLLNHGVDPQETFFIVRLISFEASHDVARHGFSQRELDSLLHKLSQHGKVLVSSEKTRGLTVWGGDGRNLPPTLMHDLLAYATLFIGEGTTMATEAAILGTPAITTTPHLTGNRQELQERYGLVVSLQDPQAVLAQVDVFLNTADLRNQWLEKRRQLLTDKIDVTAYIVEEIEQYFAQKR